jgi:hypothetical protein
MVRKVAWLAVLVLAVGLATQVRSAPPAGGSLKVTTQGLVVDLQAPTGQKVSLPANKEVPAPPGPYKTVGITQYGQENAGGKAVMWSIKCTGPFGKVATLSVSAGKTTTIEAGAPLTVRPTASVAKSEGKGTMISVGLAVVGSAQESYNTGSILRGKTRVPPPKAIILDENGKEVNSGNFEYG